MYTDRNIYVNDEENQNTPGHNHNLSHNSQEKAFPQSGELSETISASHVKSLFQPQNEELFEHPAKVLCSMILSPQYELPRLFMGPLHCRYKWVYTHSVNVALISLMMADRLGLDEEQQETLAIGALLHDVGKLRIPRAILEKESSLSNEEMALMKKHSEFGLKLVAACGLPQEITDVIIQHHERLDGSGYPYGLQAGQISRLAEITMIADVIDAITSHRPYRPAWSISEALSLIKQDGDKFNREYVALIENMHRE